MTWAAYRVKTGLGFAQPATLTIKPRQVKHPLIARLGGSSDFGVFHQVFSSDEYAPLRNISPCRFILDLGANVGYSSAYLLNRFPNATILAVEPDPGNFEICRRNLLPYGTRAQVLQGAVWSRRSTLALSRGLYRDGREWATQVREMDGSADAATVEGWDVESLIQMAGAEQVDLLKVDIERSELEIFGNNASKWLSCVRNICIELHGADCREAFLDALQSFDYDLEDSGELSFCHNVRRKTSSQRG